MPTRSKNEGHDRSATKDAPAPVHAVVAEGASRAWDPYDVWLRRVKQPRDDRSPRRAEAVLTRAAVGKTPSAETGTHPQLVLPPLR